MCCLHTFAHQVNVDIWGVLWAHWTDSRANCSPFGRNTVEAAKQEWLKYTLYMWVGGGVVLILGWGLLCVWGVCVWCLCVGVWWCCVCDARYCRLPASMASVGEGSTDQDVCSYLWNFTSPFDPRFSTVWVPHPLRQIPPNPPKHGPQAPPLLPYEYPIGSSPTNLE